MTRAFSVSKAQVTTLNNDTLTGELRVHLAKGKTGGHQGDPVGC
jgi:hypothetical protein